MVHLPQLSFRWRQVKDDFSVSFRRLSCFALLAGRLGHYSLFLDVRKKSGFKFPHFVLFYLFCFWWYRDWTQGFHKKIHPQPFLFWNRVSLSHPGWALPCCPPALVSQGVGITSVCPPTWLLCILKLVVTPPPRYVLKPGFLHKEP